MKATMLYVAVFALVLLTVPMIAMNFEVPDVEEIQVHTPSMPESSAAPSAPEDAKHITLPGEDNEPAAESGGADIPFTEIGVQSFRILDETTGEVAEVSVRDFVRGAVAAEMPASYHKEALKAQAVAAHTFALHNHLVQLEVPDLELKGADFSADPQNLKVYITEEIAREFYGAAADEHWAKICEAADEVVDLILEYEDEPIVAAYHAISAGMTEDAGNVWTGTAPYLQPVESEGDILAPEYESTVLIPADELRETLLAAYPEMILDDDPGEWFSSEVRSDSGYVTEIMTGNMALHGKDLRVLLDLRSHNFDIVYTDRGFEFTSYGYGHGVGLSQYGSDYLARQGYSYREILETYYTDAQLKRVRLDEAL